jgi:hypothetical protein
MGSAPVSIAPPYATLVTRPWFERHAQRSWLVKLAGIGVPWSGAPDSEAPMRPEVDFQTARVEEIVEQYFRHGCVLLRRFCAVAALADFREKVDLVHREVNQVHIGPSHLLERGLQLPQYYLFSQKHYDLLQAVYGDLGYSELEGNVTRRMDPQGRGGGWQAPLPPHLDACVHPPGFTVNFWVPLQPCGVDLPSLGVVCTSFDEVLRYTGYSEAKIWNDAEEPGLSWGHFRPEMKAMWRDDPQLIESFKQQFDSKIWLPEYDFGDAMMSSNWTLHFTHAAKTMNIPRINLELRFISTASLHAVRLQHSQPLTGA